MDSLLIELIIQHNNDLEFCTCGYRMINLKKIGTDISATALTRFMERTKVQRQP